MHCGICANTTVEVRPCHIDKAANSPITGDIYICQACATNMSTRGDMRDSVFITWVGFPCDECSHVAAFDGDIDDMPTGIVCDECDPRHLTGRGSWLCELCYDKNHYGHKQKQLQPLLDRLARL